jgi:dTDP-4-amino-4,6-dideoxygalactose transaminase
MTEFQATIGLLLFKLIDEIIEKRCRIAKMYDELVKGIPILELLLKVPENV